MNITVTLKLDQARLEEAEQQQTVKDRELRGLRLQNSALLDEQKEMSLTVEELRREISDLKRNNLDRTKWREWGCEEVFMFIMSVVDDESLEKHRHSVNEEEVRTKLFESEYDGQTGVGGDYV